MLPELSRPKRGMSCFVDRALRARCLKCWRSRGIKHRAIPRSRDTIHLFQIVNLDEADPGAGILAMQDRSELSWRQQHKETRFLCVRKGQAMSSQLRRRVGVALPIVVEETDTSICVPHFQGGIGQDAIEICNRQGRAPAT